MITPANICAALLTLIPFLASAFFGEALRRRIRSLPTSIKLALPSALSLPYLVVSLSATTFHWSWFFLYALLPIAVTLLLHQARRVDPDQTGTWRDYLVLITLGLAVDLRWFEPAWPPHLAIFNKMMLLNAGIYGFLFIRELNGVGFDLRLRLRDLRIGLREWTFYIPIALVLGLSLGFLHFHSHWPRLLQLAGAYLFTFLFIAVPEELFFRGWLQNLLERRLDRTQALLLTSALFGLSHFNKRAIHFNWRYVVLAAIAGIFYGRAWRQDRRVGASAITHTTVDTLWSIWFR
ncbi:CPBP family glutamic-type intramembrane protease [Tunturiibacter gelidiferens]|uniref:CPBP family glutamic-type intramembrane protease n=1 Tax=Tunturiibacter gelidiferens TaxID=3069689 RepID=UPI003D9BABFA